jgi:hypothetical protein
MRVQAHPDSTAAPARPTRVLAAVCGILGVIALGVYFGAAPPLPALDASAPQVADVGARYHLLLLLGAWLQATGTLLCVVFFLALVWLAAATTRLAGMLTMVGAATLLAVTAIEGAFTIDWAQAAANGHAATALTSYDVMSVFVHVFPIAPAPLVYLPLGVVLLHAAVLPRPFAYLALLLGAGFAVVGLSGLFAAAGLTLVVVASQSLWFLAAATALLARASRHPGTADPPAVLPPTALPPTALPPAVLPPAVLPREQSS